LLAIAAMTNRSTDAGIVSLLAIDSGGRACSAALWRSGRRSGGIAAQETIASDHGQAAQLMPLIERVMAKAGTGYADLDRIAVAVGPGSFTGLRVGLAAAIGLGLAVARPVVGISSFQAAAFRLGPGLRDGRRLFVALDSRREEHFLAELDDGLRIAGKPRIAGRSEIRESLRQAGPVILTGDAPILTEDGWPANILTSPAAPDAACVAMLAADPSRRFDLAAEPFYLRPPDVTPKKMP
jgi:tRNA threonylcarbamoyladenosine biosynthesis protein TsaB